jgi:hypothetical protein
MDLKARLLGFCIAADGGDKSAMPFQAEGQTVETVLSGMSAQQRVHPPDINRGHMRFVQFVMRINTLRGQTAETHPRPGRPAQVSQVTQLFDSSTGGHIGHLMK